MTLNKVVVVAASLDLSIKSDLSYLTGKPGVSIM